MEYASSSSVKPESSSSSVASSSSEEKSSSSEKVSSSSEESSSSVEESSSSEQPQAIAKIAGVAQSFRYVASEARLEIYTDNIRRLDIFDMKGHVVKLATEAVSQSSVDLSSLKPGVYLVRLMTSGMKYQQTVIKR